MQYLCMSTMLTTSFFIAAYNLAVDPFTAGVILVLVNKASRVVRPVADV